MEEKTALWIIWMHTYFDCGKLADMADVTFVAVYKMLLGKPVARWQAEYVLNALSQLTGKNYSLDTVDVVLYPDPT
jgi:hypothetical protein